MTNGTLSTGTTGWVKNGKTIIYRVTYLLGTGNTRVTATVGSCTSGCSNAGTFAGIGHASRFVPGRQPQGPCGQRGHRHQVGDPVLF